MSGLPQKSKTSFCWCNLTNKDWVSIHCCASSLDYFKRANSSLARESFLKLSPSVGWDNFYMLASPVCASSSQGHSHQPLQTCIQWIRWLSGKGVLGNKTSTICHLIVYFYSDKSLCSQLPVVVVVVFFSFFFFISLGWKNNNSSQEGWKWLLCSVTLWKREVI